MRSQSRRVGEGQTEKAEKEKMRSVRSTRKRKKDLRTHLVGLSMSLLSMKVFTHVVKSARPYR